MSFTRSILAALFTMFIAAAALATPAYAEDHWERVDLQLRASGTTWNCLRGVDARTDTRPCSTQLVSGPKTLLGQEVKVIYEPAFYHEPATLTLSVKEPNGTKYLLRGRFEREQKAGGALVLSPEHALEALGLTEETYLLPSASDAVAGQRGGPLTWSLTTQRDLRTKLETSTATISGYLHTKDFDRPSIQCGDPPTPTPGHWWAIICWVRGFPKPTVKVIDGEIPRKIELDMALSSEAEEPGQLAVIRRGPSDEAWTYPLGGAFTLELTNRAGSARERVTIPNPPGLEEPTSVEVEADQIQMDENEPVTLTAQVEGRRSGLPAPGTVQFQVGMEPVGHPVTLHDGFAELTVRLPLKAGTYEVHAVYRPNGPFLGGRGTAYHKLLIKPPAPAVDTPSTQRTPAPASR